MKRCVLFVFLSGPALAAVSLLVSTAMLAGCKQPAGSQHPGGMPPPEVAVVEIVPAPVPATFEYVGQTAGSREVEVRARVTGILQKRNFVEGGAVSRGQSLFTLDQASFETALARAEAELAGAEARLAQAQRNAARLKPLYEAKAASQKEYEDAVAAEAIAVAEVKAQRARLAEARLNLGYTRVEAPVSGIAGRTQRSEGNFVSGPDVLLTTVVQIDPMYVLFGMSDEERLKLVGEAEAGRLTLPKDGRFEVTIKLADGRVYDKAGKVNFSDVRVNGDTGTSEMRAELPNPAALLRPGQFVRVTLSGAQRPDAIQVPQRAVLQGPQGKFVYVVSVEGKADPRPVEVGDWRGDAWLINKGLQAGDKVIVDGVMKIGPGAPVRIAKGAAANPAKP
jgi:membrane fusion protein (multidrug efflux system)